jgi:hypothetical protein
VEARTEGLASFIKSSALLHRKWAAAEVRNAKRPQMPIITQSVLPIFGLESSA